jgi:small subunit ribosomal protein S6
MKRPYEVTTLIRILASEDETQAAINQIVAYIEENDLGKITRIDRTSLGRRKLAYEIDKQRDGLYVLFFADIEPSHITELELNLRLYNSVLRHLVVRADEAPAPKKKPVPIIEAVAAEADADEVVAESDASAEGE